MLKNYGIDIQKEKQEQDGTEYKFGAFSTPCLAQIPRKERVKYNPLGELQNIGEEKSGCVTRGYLNNLARKFTYLLRTGKLLPINEQFFRKNGYVVIYPDGQEGIDFSDAFIEIKSGTTRQGNSMKAPAQAIHEWGLIPKKMLPQLESFDEHYDPKRITKEMENLGKSFITRFPIGYDQVRRVHLDTSLEEESVGCAGYAWPNPINGVYPRVDLPYTHFFDVFDLKYQAFDNYLDEGRENDFIKTLAPDYDLYEYGYRIYIVKQNDINDIKTIGEAYSWLKWLFSILGINYGKKTV